MDQNGLELMALVYGSKPSILDREKQLCIIVF